MGYWNAGADGSSLHREKTGLVWGDQVADILDEALKRVITRFKEDVGRLPTRQELEAGLKFSLGSYDPQTYEEPHDEDQH